MGKIILNNSNNNEFTSSYDNKNTDSRLNAQEKDEFAGAFPEWDLVPPLQVIKRVRRSL